MATYDGWVIKTGFLEGNLFDSTEGIDVHASSAKYAEECRKALAAEFPGARIEVDYQENTQGATPCTLKTHAYHQTDPESNLADMEDEQIAERADWICEQVFNMGSWIVESK